MVRELVHKMYKARLRKLVFAGLKEEKDQGDLMCIQN